MADFFALEAGDYLERLDALIQKTERPIEEFVRLARALRGSALMASQPAMPARPRESRRWRAACAKGATPGTCDGQMPRARWTTSRCSSVGRPNWSAADTTKADALSAELEQRAGRPVAPTRRRGAGPGRRRPRVRRSRRSSDRQRAGPRRTGAAREPTGTGPAAGRVARAPAPARLGCAHRSAAASRSAGRHRADHRGVGAPDFRPPANVAEVFAAAAAIAQGAREVAERGRPDPEARRSASSPSCSCDSTKPSPRSSRSNRCFTTMPGRTSCSGARRRAARDAGAAGAGQSR